MTKRIGMLTPSSNTVLEPVTMQLLGGRTDVSVHFARFRVTEIGLGSGALGQFDVEPVLAAARLLADAKVDVIAWNGTSGSWLGLGRDRTLASAIETATGIPAITCTLGFFDAFRQRGIRRIGLVTPYTGDVQERIIQVYREEGVDIVAESHTGLSDNFSFSDVGEPDIAQALRAVLTAKPDAAIILCTNMRGAAVASRLEAETGIPILDSVAVTLDACLRRIAVT